MLFLAGSAALVQISGAPLADPHPPSLGTPARPPDPAQDDIVVTAKRYGEARVAAETEFDENEIASHGADSIQELVDRLKPFIGNGDDELVLLVNGRPLGGDASLMTYPAEALTRLAVLKPEAAAQYGYSSSKRVVNLVLKQKFSSLNADASASLATAGGQHGTGLTVGRVAINGPVRWNVQASVNRDGSLLKSARRLQPRDGIFDSVGYVTGLNGAEIDPALSLAAGEIVTVAAIPVPTSSQAPTLADFTTTANRVHAVDPDDFETLSSSRRSFSVVGGVTVPLGDFSASLTLSASNGQTTGLRGLPMASIILPVGSRWSPFASDVALIRPFAGDRPLRIRNDSTSLGMSFSVSGMIGRWQSNLFINYSRSESSGLLERGVDTNRIQQLVDVDDPVFNPYGPLDESLLLADRDHSRSDNLSARVNVGKSIIDLPAGPLTVNYSLDVGRNRSNNRRRDNLDVVTQASGQIAGQMSLSVPLSRKRAGEAWSLGDMVMDLSLSGQKMSDNGLQKRWAAGMNWSPRSFLQLRGTFDYAETAPSFSQLNGPLVTTISRIFDFARQETIDVVRVTGGNPNLGSGSQRNLSLTARLLLLDDQALAFDVGYRAQTATGGQASFPELTPVIEAAFPERVTRDAEGRLVSIDARAINIAHNVSAELSSGIALRLPRQSGGAKSWGDPSADPWQFSVSLNHRWRLKDELLTRPGVPVIDQLGSDGGQSRHFLTLQATAGKRGIGATLNGNWSSAARVRTSASANVEQDFRSKLPVTFSLSAFAEPEHILRGAGKSPWMKNLKFSLDIQNLLNGYRQVTLGDGSVPRGYSRDEIDPLGRTMRLTVRKRF
ncbi:MAG: hypothetical protein V4564_18085 [Pseudomonadota bacterium]